MITSGRKILSVNTKMCDVWGYTKQELVGKTTCKLYAGKEDYNNIGILLQFNNQFTAKAHLKKKDGTVVLTKIKITKNEEENYVTVYFNNILEES